MDSGTFWVNVKRMRKTRPGQDRLRQPAHAAERTEQRRAGRGLAVCELPEAGLLRGAWRGVSPIVAGTDR